MLATHCDNVKIVGDSLCGARPIDEETFSSISVLQERLERLKKNSNLFADITFSPHVDELASHEMMLAIS